MSKEYKALTLPKLGWDKQSISASFGRLVAEPLEPGFGVTLGNAMRRVLLGAIEGTAVTSIVVKGVNNEFSSIPGVVEDLMQIVLNIKQIVIKNNTNTSGKMKLSVSSAKTVTVADIICDEHLEVLNHDHVIAHVSQGGVLDIEFTVESGRGYHVAKWPLGQSLQEDGRIYLDAMFSPVRNVTCNVEKTRVGKDIDFDKMTLEITTNGSIAPVEALNYAVSVLRTQFEQFLGGSEIPFNEISCQEVNVNPVDVVEVEDFGLKGVSLELLMKPIDELEFSARAHNCLINADIRRVIDLVNFTEDEGLKIKNFGRKSLDEVKEILRSLGLRLGMDIKEEVVVKALQKQSK